MQQFEPGQRIRVQQDPRAPKEAKSLNGVQGTVQDPPYSRLGYLRVQLDALELPFGAPYLLHPENVQPC